MKDEYKLAVATLIIGFGLGLLVFHSVSIRGEVRAGGNYTYINPLLECDLGQDYISKNGLSAFPGVIDDTIAKEEDIGDITYAAFYFRDLNDGPWFGVNQDDDFRPASLLKVPLMLNIFRKSEMQPGFLDKSVVYDGDNLPLTQNIKPAQTLKKGESYTIRQYMDYMIKYSDNRATAALLKQADDNRLEELFKVLGINTPTNDTGEDSFISLKEYSSFFRILFNSSYLNYDDSEAALALLSEADFKDGIRAGVPASVKVADKFGESTDPNTRNPQLHDCGIVYYPKKPYLLCVSVKGPSFDKLEAAVQEISRVSYNEVSKQVKP